MFCFVTSWSFSYSQYSKNFGFRLSQFKTKIEIRPIDALFKVLEFTTFSIYLFQFEYQSDLSEIPIEWHLIWVTFRFEWHSGLNDVPIWVMLHFEWHSILSDEIWEIWGIWGTVNFQSVCESVSIIRPRDASASKNLLVHRKNSFLWFSRWFSNLLTN
jgi:hypothetical protein